MAELTSQHRATQDTQAEAVRQRKGAAVLQDNRGKGAQTRALSDNRTVQLAPKPNNTGLPNQLKTGIESLSGMSMDHVKVHYNSSQPAQLNAHAYAQGSNIHLAPGQEKHLPHEAWHVVQQAQGRVKPTMQMKTGVPVNDDAGLESEADLMGAKALQRVEGRQKPIPDLSFREGREQTVKNEKVVQCVELPDLKDSFGEPVDTDYQYTVQNYVGEHIVSNPNETAIEQLIAAVKKHDPNKLGEVQQIIHNIRLSAQYQKRHLADVMKNYKLVQHGSRKALSPKVPAKPFQLATVQFDGEYDLKAYAEEIKIYSLECSAKSLVPVIEFRLYDGAFKTNLDMYQAQARKSLKKILGKKAIFDIIFSPLRDETMEAGTPATDNASEWIEKVQEFLNSAKTDLDMEKDSEARGLFLRGNVNEKALKKVALDLPKHKMQIGQMMVPVQEALDFDALSNLELEHVYENVGAHYSLHQRLLAKVIILNRPLEALQKGHLTGGNRRLVRSNSLVKPHSLTMTNLVTGDEVSTLQSTLSACRAAFRKGVEQVLLTIEVRGTEGGQRGYMQISALQQRGYHVDILGFVRRAQGVQQSGVKLAEPGEIPERIKIKVSLPKPHQVPPKKDEFLSHWIGEQGFKSLVASYSYHRWYQQQVHEDIYIADEYESTYYPQYLDDLCALYPQYIIYIHDLNSKYFAQVYPQNLQKYYTALQQSPYKVAELMERSDLPAMHQQWNELGVLKERVRHLVLSHQAEFPNVFDNIFHHQRKRKPH